MTVRKAAMFGFDEGKASARDRRGGGQSGGVPARGSPPPAGSNELAAARPLSPRNGVCGRLADVGRHSTSAGPEGAAAHAVAVIRAWSAQGLQRMRSSATCASNWRRRCVMRARWPALRSNSAYATWYGASRRISLTFGTNREPSGDGLTLVEQGASRPALMAGCPGRRSTSRRHGRGRTSTRRRDARPIRSGGRRGQDTGLAGASCRRLLVSNDADVVKVGPQLADGNFAASKPIDRNGLVGRDAFQISF